MGFIFLALTWLIPTHIPPWVNFQSEFLAFLCLAWLSIGLLLKAAPNLRLTAAPIAIACVSIVPWLQFGTGVIFFAGDALISSLYLASFAVAVVVGYSYSQAVVSPSKNDWLIWPAVMLLAAAMVSSIIGLLQWLSQTDGFHVWVMHTEPGERILANLGQPNQLASLLLMGIVALAFLFERGQVGRFALVLGVGFMTVLLALTESRTSLLGCAAIALFLLQKHRSCQLKLPATAIFFWALAFGVAFFFLMPWVNEALLFTDGRNIPLTDENGRGKIWQQTVYAIGQAPWGGYGWNQTPAAHAVGALQHPGVLAFTYSHNLILDLLTWAGVLVGGLLTVLCLYWLVSRIARVITKPAIYAMAMLLPVAIHSMLEFPFAYAFFLITVGILIGVVEASLTDIKSIAVSRYWAVGIVASLTLVGAYASYEYVLVEEDYRVARFEDLKVGRTPADYTAPPIALHTQLAALLTTLRQPAVPLMSAQDIERLRQVSLRFGMRLLVFRYAVALGLNGDPIAATRQMQVLRGMFGERSYQAAKEDMRRLALESYSQLSSVNLP